MLRIAVLLFTVATAAPASAQFIVAPVGVVTQSYGYRYLTPFGVAYGRTFQSRPVFGVVGFIPPPPPPIIFYLPPLEAPPPHVEDPIAAARIDGAVKRGDLLVVKPRKNEVRPVEFIPPPALEPPPNEPVARSRYLVDRARESFAEGEYGRAAERLQAAIALAPEVPLPYFLLAQVRMARGEYPEAVAAIRDGMRRAPDWPAAKFDPAGLYPRPELFDPDLERLKAALAAKPDDPALLFLSGYQLWFLGDRKEAVKLFQRASARTKENAIIERFLLETVG